MGGQAGQGQQGERVLNMHHRERQRSRTSVHFCIFNSGSSRSGGRHSPHPHPIIPHPHPTTTPANRLMIKPQKTSTSHKNPRVHQAASWKPWVGLRRWWASAVLLGPGSHIHTLTAAVMPMARLHLTTKHRRHTAGNSMHTCFLAETSGVFSERHMQSSLQP